MLRSMTNLPVPPSANLSTCLLISLMWWWGMSRRKVEGLAGWLGVASLPALLCVRLELCQIDKVAAFATLLNELIEFALAVFGHPAAGKDIGYGHAKGDAHDGDG